MNIKSCLLLLIVATHLTACVTSPTGRSQLMMISPEAAIVYSQKAYFNTVRELRQKNMLVKNAQYNDAIQTATGRLVAQAVKAYPHTKQWEWSIAVINSPGTVNAWAMAGGRMAIYTGVFEKLKLNEAEFAQIMGHEIAHTLANHTAERMSIALVTQLGVIGTAIASDADRNTTRAAMLAAQYALQLPNSRASESEADRMGIELAARAGYDPQAAVTLWEKMERVSGSGPPQFLSTHPSPKNRREKLAALVPEMRRIKRPSKGPVWPVTLAR